MIAYFNGNFLPKDQIHITPDDRGFLFADGAYEVIRCYRGKLFMAEAHLQRLKRSLEQLRIDFSDIDQLLPIATKLIAENQLTDGQATVYIQVTRGAAPRTHRFPAKETPATVYLAASRFQPHQDELDHGTKIILVSDTRWSRCDIKSIALLPNILAHQLAIDRGATEAVFVRDGCITEGTHTNVAAIFNGTFVTAPASNYILSGITRQIVIELCGRLGIPVKEFPILEVELHQADELMLIGTTVEITPVVQVEDRRVANGKPGLITQKLQRSFYELIAWR
ncbi:MAG: aminotransferase class IV [candidate division KSB1 bacterium]|nr:aminotransferase class IV [candidate division KSB1 bacterium]MDZ7335070.1 aminotransferase class IV [candidate division KSB1 bacterium]MDZ7356261.1 aminotransferase class IV [candidate division KSB1 bacterium]MDZ7375123.1 aminotransferase class IV [candidate division KSB1 bacterium]MDZ7400066.1 aminotransferase class IV [candidate division KSB1 bacterium]